jgi:Rrf2 family protein
MISQRARYAIKALLALAATESGKPLQTREIAEYGGSIPRSFLEQILLDLKSRRGKEGGFRLAKPASEITLGNVLRIMDGPIAPLSCLSVNFYRRCDDCQSEENCALRIGLMEAYKAQVESLERTSLADMLAQANSSNVVKSEDSSDFSGSYI